MLVSFEISEISLIDGAHSAQQKFEPWYPFHPERDLYISLLQKADPPASESLLKAALLRRAAEDVSRIIKIREDKPALQALMQKGSVGDDLWSSCITAEKELEAELLEVVAEANTFHSGWGQFIFGSAGEILGHEKIKDLLLAIDRKHQDAGMCTLLFSKRQTHIIQIELRYGRYIPTRPVIPASNTPETPQSPPAKLTVPVSPANGNASLSDSESVISGTASPSNSKKPVRFTSR